jgi:hypothetical protein
MVRLTASSVPAPVANGWDAGGSSTVQVTEVPSMVAVSLVASSLNVVATAWALGVVETVSRTFDVGHDCRMASPVKVAVDIANSIA